MTTELPLLAWLSQPEPTATLTGIQRGIEKESLRITPNGLLAQTPHSAELGSALMHDVITTDYSEALLEFITAPSSSISEVLSQLENTHLYVYRHIGDELLWVNSMPCQMGNGDASVPVAQYGSSNRGKMKTVYRLGLGLRYGRVMQTIAGIHFNFSLPDSFWHLLHQHQNSELSLQDFKTEHYFGIIRNFRSQFWLLVYLFGASPAICRSFVKGKDHHLVPFQNDDHSLHLPYATSLRMGDLGYQSNAQSSLIICYNSLDNYIRTIKKGLQTPYVDYEQFGIKNENGEHHQLSTHLLQIENEFYSSIRPKRAAKSGETPIGALKSRGVEYIEVRCLDLNPFLPNGIDATTIRFVELFLLYCTLSHSPLCNNTLYREGQANQRTVVTEGRNPNAMLLRDGEQVQLRHWAASILGSLPQIATIMDNAHGGTEYQQALAAVQATFDDPSQLPSAKILAEMAQNNETYAAMAMRHARQQQAYFSSTPLSSEIEAQFVLAAADSIAHQQELEQQPQVCFDTFLQSYFNQYNAL